MTRLASNTFSRNKVKNTFKNKSSKREWKNVKHDKYMDISVISIKFRGDRKLTRHNAHLFKTAKTFSSLHV